MCCTFYAALPAVLLQSSTHHCTACHLLTLDPATTYNQSHSHVFTLHAAAITHKQHNSISRPTPFISMEHLFVKRCINALQANSVPSRHSFQLNTQFLITENQVVDPPVGSFAVEFNCGVLKGNGEGRYNVIPVHVLRKCVWWRRRNSSTYSEVDGGNVHLFPPSCYPKERVAVRTT